MTASSSSASPATTIQRRVTRVRTRSRPRFTEPRGQASAPSISPAAGPACASPRAVLSRPGSVDGAAEVWDLGMARAGSRARAAVTSPNAAAPGAAEPTGTPHEPDRLGHSRHPGCGLRRDHGPGGEARPAGPSEPNRGHRRTVPPGRPDRRAARRGPAEEEVERGLLRLHLLPGGLPHDAAGAGPDRKAAGPEG